MGETLSLIQVVGLLKSKTIKDASIDMGISYGKLYNFCKKHKLKSSIPSKGGRKCETDKYVDEVVRDYLAGMSQPQIAKKLGIAQATVHKIVKVAAHKMRTRSEAARLREADKGVDIQKQQAAAANAVRHALAIVNRFSW